ncbi:3'-5' exonuclease [Coraliomargarita parva]|uniref:3'-5' exonuclease n=1 Tax=Coraliomargarita parva TaxID=3014050 RepID=UPI0022B52DDF|nr:3'-5' exonuclease [Coraliomargarita parva]
MNFRLASTFNDSLLKLTGDEQKVAKTTAFDLQLNPANPGMSFHKLDKAKDKNFWSVRVSRDIRIIVHKTSADLLLCYVGHHDDAYNWAERRKLETHPKTGAAQIVEIRETVQEILVPVYIEEEQASLKKPAIFDQYSEDELLDYGVPEEWLNDVKKADEDSILELAEHLPEEAAEALLELATGGTPVVAQVVSTPDDAVNPFEHPDAQRRFRVMTNVEELEQALDYPWEKWTIFLHPSQREIVERSYSGPARISGTAGTGKTIVALHRAVYLARKHEDARILLTTFSDELAQALRVKLRRLISNQPMLGERIDVEAMNAVGQRLYLRNQGDNLLAPAPEIERLITEAVEATGCTQFSSRFLASEWEQVVDAWQLQIWEDYRDVKRLGRKSRLTESKRQQLWEVFSFVQSKLNERNQITQAGLFTELAKGLNEATHPAYDFAVIDEAQDVSVAQLRFLAALGNDRPEALFFTGDLGQRIFQQPFSWSSLGVNIRGRSKTLRINYRTSHQIRRQADRLLDQEISDVDGNTEKRTDTVSVFNGPAPRIQSFDTENEEIEAVSTWLKECKDNGIAPNEMGVFVRSEKELDRAQEAIAQAGLVAHQLAQSLDVKRGAVALSTMHLAKGLEFRAVAVMACDDEVVPSQERIEQIGDAADLEDIYNTERHLLYVACTRARDHLLITSTVPGSEFLDDLRIKL